ncbi:MAG: hypothetical protein MJ245_03980 [Clostridia bacterium]|nr:hypothetical protein [Clostridia bacterium]
MDDKKRYKATDVKVDGPFDGWIIEELTEEEMEKEDARQKEIQEQVKKPAGGGSAPAKLSPEELQKKREEQLNKIKDLINQKRREKQEAQEKAKAQAQPQPQPQPQMTQREVEATSPSVRQEEDLETMLLRKSKETGIPVEVLRMIEEKKKELRERKKKANPNGGGVEIYDTVKARREKEEQEKYYAEHQERKVVKKKAPNGEEIGDRETIYPEEKGHDLYNVMDDVGLDEPDMDDR